jgi:hypothetical protein
MQFSDKCVVLAAAYLLIYDNQVIRCYAVLQASMTMA